MTEWRNESHPRREDYPHVLYYEVETADGRRTRASWDTRGDCFVDAETLERVTGIVRIRPEVKP